jgi:hypothetical protein
MRPIPGLDVEHRLRRLERFNRILAVGLGLTLGAGLMAAALPHRPTAVVQAERFQLVDADGQVRIDLRHTSDETGLFIMDDAGGTRLGAAQFAHGGGGFALHGPDMKGAAVLYLKGDGSLTFYDTEGQVTHRVPESAPR